MRSSFLMMASTSVHTRGYVVTMMEFVTSSGMKRVSLPAPASSRKPGPRAAPGPPGVVVRELGAMLVWLGNPGAPVVVGRPVVVEVVLVEGDPEPRPKMASSVAARSFDLVFSAK